MNPALERLLSPLYDGALAPAHRADLEKSGLSVETIAQHKIRSVPPAMIDSLLGFKTPNLVSAYAIPFPNPHGGWLSHIRVKVFPPYTDRQGRTVKYLGPKGAPPRLYFPIPTMEMVVSDEEPVWLCEGTKKALAIAQLGLPAIGFEGIEGWHAKGTTTLLEDFTLITVKSRVIELVPDGDVRMNPAVARGAARFAEALQASGARVRLRLLPISQEAA